MLVGQPTDDRVDPDLDQPGGDEHGGDRERAVARVVEPERDEDVERAEEERGERVEPQAADEAPVAKSAPDRARRLQLPTRRLATRATPAASAAATSATTRERGPDSGQLRRRRRNRADDEAGDGEPEHRAERLPATLARDAHGDPRQRAGPRRGARETLREPRDAERDRTAGEREAEAREPRGRARPTKTPRFGPMRPTSSPPGIPPTSAPPP